MNQYSTTPEYTVVESEKIHLTGNLLDNSDRNYLALLADLEILSKEAIKLESTFAGITSSLHMLVLSLREQA